MNTYKVAYYAQSYNDITEFKADWFVMDFMEARFYNRGVKKCRFLWWTWEQPTGILVGKAMLVMHVQKID